MQKIFIPEKIIKNGKVLYINENLEKYLEFVKVFENVKFEEFSNEYFVGYIIFTKSFEKDFYILTKGFFGENFFSTLDLENFGNYFYEKHSLKKDFGSEIGKIIKYLESEKLLTFSDKKLFYEKIGNEVFSLTKLIFQIEYLIWESKNSFEEIENSDIKMEEFKGSLKLSEKRLEMNLENLMKMRKEFLEKFSGFLDFIFSVI